MDVKREKELDERRKNEKIEISKDHPVRKLLLRMKERHSMRIAFASTLNETGFKNGDSGEPNENKVNFTIFKFFYLYQYFRIAILLFSSYAK